MSRPRTISNHDVEEAVAALVARDGPSGLTFASASAVAGLSPAALVQRYHNREALLRAALLWMWDQLDRTVAAADARHPIDPEGAIALLVRLSESYGAEDDTAQGLLLLREDFRDPALRARGVAWNQAMIQALGRRLSDDPTRQKLLGQLMASQWQGALLWWGFSRKGTLRGFLRRELRQWLRTIGILS